MREFFTVNGYKVDFHNGLAEFHKYGILIRCEPSEFTYAWVVKMDYKLSVLRGII
jgi:hypothetical protein